MSIDGSIAPSGAPTPRPIPATHATLEETHGHPHRRAGIQMTQQIETRFRCDRCRNECYVAHNDQPALERGRPPQDWTPLRVGEGPPLHLCAECSIDFATWLHVGGR